MKCRRLVVVVRRLRGRSDCEAHNLSKSASLAQMRQVGGHLGLDHWRDRDPTMASVTSRKDQNRAGNLQQRTFLLSL